jgi:hypothetical protein
MTFEEVLDQAMAMLQQRGRLTYRTLKLHFRLDDEHLEALKDELIYGQRLAVVEDGRVLVWTGGEEALAHTSMQVPSPSMGEGEGGGGVRTSVPPILTFPRQGGRDRPGEIVPLLATLLSVLLSEGRYSPLLLSPQQQQQRTLDALVAWLLDEAEQQPVLPVWEDLHWADPSTPRPRARDHRRLCSRGDVALPWRIACGSPAPGGRQRTLHARPVPYSGVPHGP